MLWVPEAIATSTSCWKSISISLAILSSLKTVILAFWIHTLENLQTCLLQSVKLIYTSTTVIHNYTKIIRHKVNFISLGTKTLCSHMDRIKTRIFKKYFSEINYSIVKDHNSLITNSEINELWSLIIELISAEWLTKVVLQSHWQM